VQEFATAGVNSSPGEATGGQEEGSYGPVQVRGSQRSPMPSAKFVGKKPPASALHAAHNRLKVS
jgi:hypothetical protein